MEQKENLITESDKLKKKVVEITDRILKGIDHSLIELKKELCEEEGKDVQLDPNLAFEYVDGIIVRTVEESFNTKLFEYAKLRIKLINTGENLSK